MVENPGRPVRKVSWEEFDTLAIELAKAIKEEMPQIHAVHGIARGGLALAVRISHLLDIRFIQDINQVEYFEYFNEDLIIIDDICDSGTTMNNIAKYVKYPVFGCLFVRENANIKHRTIAAEEITDEWIEFPWEAKVEI